MSLYGEVQKEVIGATLATDFGLEVGFRKTTTICIERPLGTGTAVERLGKEPNPFLATVGLRIEPAAAGSGVRFQIEAEPGSMPLAFFAAVEDTVRRTLRQGLHGWEVTDCTVAMTHSGYLAKHSLGHQRFNKSLSSTGEDFRNLTPLVVMDALRRAGTVVCEPIHRFRLDAPADTLGAVLPSWPGWAPSPAPRSPGAGRICWRARFRPPGCTSSSSGCRLRPAARACWSPPSTATGHNPLDRKEYLLHIQRRV